MSSTMWHYLWQNQQTGPIPEGELRRLFAEGRLPLETLVWSPGMAQWAPALQLAAFQPGQAPVPAPQQQVAPSAMAPATPLSPSEVVFFHAERFAPPAGMINAVELLHAPQKVKAVELGQAIMAVAFLAAEREGSITLAIKDQKALFGLKTNKVLELGRGPHVINWPPESLEAGIAMLVQQGRNSIGDIVHALLLEDAAVPAMLPYSVIRDSQVRKGLVQRHEQKGLLGAVTYRYSLAPQAMQIAGGHDPSPWLQLITETQRSRPELWGALVAGIQNGFARRKEVDMSSNALDMDFD